jgi:crotonobetainyl-CoA:carnitine CoA-transferase CaiB-like acyl-CoA transferase
VLLRKRDRARRGIRASFAISRVTAVTIEPSSRKTMLNGIRVLDLTRVLAGPLCTMMLGDLGADIIKVERPGSGDETRGWGPPFDARGESAYYLSVNRNKLSAALDLEDVADREIIERLALEADVVVDNFRRGTLERRGLDPKVLMERNPRLIWCTITGFGSESRRPGYDFVTQAESGWMAITGDPTGDPMKVGVALADVVAGKDAVAAILAALVARSRDGAGRRLFISLMDSARAALVNVAQNALVTGEDASRWGNAHPNLVPYQLFDAADRPIVIAVGSDAQWLSCARALGLPELADDPTLATNAGRLAQRERIIKKFSSALRVALASQWLERLDAVGVPAGVVKSVREVTNEVDASPVSGMPPSVGGGKSPRFPPPRLDEHGGVIRHSGWRVFDATFGQSDGR